MDRTLKERIIGAIVLVVFVVLVVPIFLDGPPGEGEIVTETVKLPGQSEQKMQTRVLERNRSTPEPKEESSSGRETANEPTPEPIAAGRSGRETANEPAPKPIAESGSGRETANEDGRETANDDGPETVVEQAPAPEEISTTGLWAVQLGAFSDQAKADKLAADLRQQGFAAFLTKVSTDKGQLHRVRIGPQADRTAAEAVAKKLESSGHTSRVVPHP